MLSFGIGMRGGQTPSFQRLHQTPNTVQDMIFCLANTFSPLPWPIKSAQCSLNSLFTGNRLTRRIVKSKYHTCRARHFGIAQAMEKNAATTEMRVVWPQRRRGTALAWQAQQKNLASGARRGGAGRLLHGGHPGAVLRRSAIKPR